MNRPTLLPHEAPTLSVSFFQPFTALALAAALLMPTAQAQAQGLGDFFRRGVEKISETVDRTVGDGIEAVVEKVQGEDAEQAPAGPVAAQTKPGAEAAPMDASANDASGGDAPWRYPSLRSLPLAMLAYKFDPALFDDAYLLEMTERQIVMDQGYYDSPADYRFPTFSEEEVTGRNAEFAARDMLDAYKVKLAEAADRVPLRFTRIIEVRPEYDHAAGRLHQPYRPDLLIEWATVRDAPAGHEDRAVHRMNAGSDLPGSSLAKLEERFDAGLDTDPRDYGIPSSLWENAGLPSARGNAAAFMTLDRRVSVPALALDSAAAEHLLTPPPVPSAVALPGPERDAADLEYRRYLGNIFLIMDLELTGLTVDDGGYMFDTRLLGATLLGTRGETLASYAPGDFPSTRDLYERGLTLEQQQEREASEREQAERLLAERESARRAGFDILGVRMGMDMAAARAALERNFSIDALYQFAPEPERNPYAPPAYRPYRHGIIAVGKGGEDVVTLHELDGKVVGITRDFSSAELSAEDFTGAMTAKYGEPTSSTQSTWTWGDAGRWGACQASGSDLRDAEAALVEEHRAVSPPPWSGEDDARYWSGGLMVPGRATAESLAACEAVLAVQGLFGSWASKVTLRLYDHSRVAEGLRRMEEGQKEETEQAAGGLTL